MKKQNYGPTVFGALLVLFLFGWFALSKLNLPKNQNESVVVSYEKFTDDKCNISFDYPSSFTKSDSELPLAIDPLNSAVFDTQDIKSVLTYICYSNEALLPEFGDTQGKDAFQVNDRDFVRNLGYAYTKIGDKTVMFKMAYSADDIEYKKEYEDMLVEILKSLK